MFDFKLSLNEANLILAALGKAPFEQVASLIANLRQQAEPQLGRVQAEMQAAAEAEEAAQAQKVADSVQVAGQEAA